MSLAQPDRPAGRSIASVAGQTALAAGGVFFAAFTMLYDAALVVPISLAWLAFSTAGLAAGLLLVRLLARRGVPGCPNLRDDR